MLWAVLVLTFLRAEPCFGNRQTTTGRSIAQNLYNETEKKIGECICKMIEATPPFDDCPLAPEVRENLKKLKEGHCIRCASAAELAGSSAPGNEQAMFPNCEAACTSQKDGTIYINRDQPAWVNEQYHWWKKGVMLEEGTHSSQATVGRSTHYSGGTVGGYPAPLQTAFDAAFAAYREIEAAIHVLDFLKPYLTSAPASEKPQVVASYAHWLAQLRDQKKKLCEQLDKMSTVPELDVRKMLLEACKGLATLRFVLGNSELVAAGGEPVRTN